MQSRQTIDFLRRRYASAILRDDAPTAGRLRDQLDALLNRDGVQRAGADPADRVGTAARSTQAELFARFARDLVSCSAGSDPEILRRHA